MIDLQTALALINLGGLVVAIFQLYRQRKDMEHLAHVTNNLERELHRLNVELDQGIQRLYRARDALIAYQKVQGMLVSHYIWKEQSPVTPSELLYKAYGESDAAMSELAGIAQAIDDKKLIELVGNIPILDPSKSESVQQQNVATRIHLIDVHQHISELISEATKAKK